MNSIIEIIANTINDFSPIVCFSEGNKMSFAFLYDGTRRGFGENIPSNGPITKDGFTKW